MKLSRSLKLLLTSDADALKLFDHTFDVTEEAAAVVAEESSGLVKLAAATVDAPIAFGGVTTARSLLVASDKDITVKLNGGSESIAVKKATGARGVLYLEGAITALTVSVPGAEDATVLYALAGV